MLGATKIVRNWVHPKSFHFWGRNLFVITGIYTHVILKAIDQSAFLNRLTNEISDCSTNRVACFSFAFLNSKMRGRLSSPKEVPIMAIYEDYGSGSKRIIYTRVIWGHVVFMIYIWWISLVINEIRISRCNVTIT